MSTRWAGRRDHATGSASWANRTPSVNFLNCKLRNPKLLTLGHATQDQDQLRMNRPWHHRELLFVIFTVNNSIGTTSYRSRLATFSLIKLCGKPLLMRATTSWWQMTTRMYIMHTDDHPLRACREISSSAVSSFFFCLLVPSSNRN